MSVLITPLDNIEISTWIDFTLNEQVKPLDISVVTKSDLLMLANLYAFLTKIHCKTPTKAEDILGEPRTIFSYEEKQGGAIELYVMVTVNMDGTIDYLTLTWTVHIDVDTALWTVQTNRKEHTKGRPTWQKHQL